MYRRGSPDLFESSDSPGTPKGSSNPTKRLKLSPLSEEAPTPALFSTALLEYPETPCVMSKVVIQAPPPPLSALSRSIFPSHSSSGSNPTAPSRQAPLSSEALFPSDEEEEEEEDSIEQECAVRVLPLSLASVLSCGSCSQEIEEGVLSMDLLQPIPGVPVEDGSSEEEVVVVVTPAEMVVQETVQCSAAITPFTAVRKLRTPFPSMNEDSAIAYYDSTPMQSRQGTNGSLHEYCFLPRREQVYDTWSPQRSYLMAQDYASGGSKSFCAVSRHHVKDLVLTASKSLRCFYSVVPPDVPVDVYVDVDYKIQEGMVCSRGFREVLLLCVLERLLEGLEQGYSVGVENLVVLDATTEKKVSYHIHCGLKGGRAFASSFALQKFLKAVFCVAESDAVRRCAYDSVDFAPYSRFCCFRLPFCVKKGRTNPLLFLRHTMPINEQLKSILYKYGPQYASDTRDVIDLCLITTGVRDVTPIGVLPGEVKVAKGTGETLLSHVIRGRQGRGEGEERCASAAAQHMAVVFRSLGGGYAKVCAADLRLKKKCGVYTVSQSVTTWCMQRQKAHTSATTYLRVSPHSIAVCCWSTHCPRPVLYNTSDIAYLTTSVIEELFGGSETQ